MQRAAEWLRELGIPFAMTALSAYRTPDEVRDYAVSAEQRGIEVIMAGSSGTNELACMIASYLVLPVIGVPLRSEEDTNASKELAAQMSTLVTPRGVPVATVGFNDVENAATLAAQILGVKDRRVRRILDEKRHELRLKAKAKQERVEEVCRQIQHQEDIAHDGLSKIHLTDVPA